MSLEAKMEHAKIRGKPVLLQEVESWATVKGRNSKGGYIYGNIIKLDVK